MLTQEQQDVIAEFANTHGRKWKSVLSKMWMNGSDANQPNGHVLRSIRNTLGPRWLKSY